MDKKTYIKPQTEATEIKLQGMIVTSPGDPGYGGGGSGTPEAPVRQQMEELLDGIDFGKL